MLYEMTYLRDGYTLADAVRPDPRWGKRIFRCEVDQPHPDTEIVQAARDTAPAGYWLHRVHAYGGDPHERVLYMRGVGLRGANPEPVTGDSA